MQDEVADEAGGEGSARRTRNDVSDNASSGRLKDRGADFRAYSRSVQAPETEHGQAWDDEDS
jgi:hypothetical protein